MHGVYSPQMIFQDSWLPLFAQAKGPFHLIKAYDEAVRVMSKVFRKLQEIQPPCLIQRDSHMSTIQWEFRVDEKKRHYGIVHPDQDNWWNVSQLRLTDNRKKEVYTMQEEHQEGHRPHKDNAQRGEKNSEKRGKIFKAGGKSPC